MKQMVEKQGVNENLKRQDQMRWVRLMNNVKAGAEEIVMREIIYVYDKVLDAGFEKELTEDFIEKYQGYYALTEDGVDYLVEPKAIGKYELDNKNFVLVARKGEQDITLMIDENKKITLALYPGRIEIDQEGKQVNVTENMTDEQRKRENELLSERKEELMPILHKALELWEAINN